MLEDRIRQSIDSALSELRSRLDAEMQTAMGEFLATRHDAEQAAAAEARTTALAEAEAAREAAVAEVEARMQASIDEAVAAARADEREQATQEVRAALESEAAQRVDAALEEERQSGAVALADAAGLADEHERAAVAAARVTEREDALAGISRLLDSVRRLDDAASLSDLLNVLTDAAAQEAPRVAVLIVKADRVHGWNVRGFGAQDDQPKAVDLALADAGVVGQAVGTARPATTRDGEMAAAGPGFAPIPPDRMGLAVPLLVGGRVVAVLYADSVGPEGHEPTVPNGWPELVEVLARHAARCLESLTVQRASKPPAARAAAPSDGRVDASPDEAPQTGHAQARHALAEDDEVSARRYARLLLSEIKLYHEPVVDEARRERRLLARLGPEIARARRLYEARIPSAVAARAALFEQELIGTLAGGDQSLLGQPA